LKENNKDVYRQPDAVFMNDYIDLREPCIIVKPLVTESPLAEAQQSGIGDFPHSTLGKRSLQIGIIFLKPHGIALSLHCD